MDCRVNLFYYLINNSFFSKLNLIRYFLVYIFLLSCTPLFSQSSPSHFMGSSLIFMPSTEDIGSKNLVFRFNHRFGNGKSGANDFFGLDQGANTQLALDYGITEKWMIGLARTSENKIGEVRSKFKIITQSSFPFSVSLFGVAAQQFSDQSISFTYFNKTWTGNALIDNKINEDLNKYELTTTDKRSYLSSILVSRRFTEYLSIQMSPMYVHQNFTNYNISNDRAGLQLGGRIKISKRIDITFDSILTPKRDYIGSSYNEEAQKSKLSSVDQFTADEINAGLLDKSLLLRDIYITNILLDEPVKHHFIPAAVGLDIETGGHVFQIFIANSRTLAHTQLLRGADFDFFKKEFNLGFNILRQFSFAPEKEAW
jgi:hypothetical protein